MSGTQIWLAPVHLAGSDPRDSPTVLDLFSAPGGMSEGFREAGFRVLATVDHDPWGCETLRRNFSFHGTKVVETDIQCINITGRVDVVAGGPPCQGFSHVGRGKIKDLTRLGNRERFIDDERNRLYKEFVRIVASVRPQFFVMENVPGIASFEGGTIIKQVTEDFEGIGYSVEMQLLKAADYGVPQIRRRAIFIGNRLGEKNRFPEESFVRRPEREQSGLSQDSHSRWYRSVRDAISDLPALQAGEGSDEMAYGSAPLTDYQVWAREGSTRLYNHVARKHSDRDVRLFKALGPGQKMTDLPRDLIDLVTYPQDIFTDKIKKQRWDYPSYAIVAHMQKDGLMFVHPDPDQPRSFTPREAARIQSFKDKFRLMGPMTQQFKQVGNAVPPALARAIANTIRGAIEPERDPGVSCVVKRLAESTVLIN